MSLVYLDIETIPSQHPWVKDFVIDGIKPPGNIKKEESIQKWFVENFDEKVEGELNKLSFDGGLCHIIAIGYAVDDAPAQCLYAQTPEEEKDILKKFLDVAFENMSATYIGHNISGFDMRVIRQRLMVLGLPRPRHIPFDAKPWDKNPYDTMVQWDAKNFVSQDKLAKIFGVEGKGGMNGSQVYDYWKAGKHKEIQEYCKSDVEMIRAIASKMNTFI